MLPSVTRAFPTQQPDTTGHEKAKGSFAIRPAISYRTAALAITLLAFLLRTYRLGYPGLEGDEAFSINTAFQSIEQIFRMTSTGEPHPPLYYLFLHWWYPLVGTSEIALRFPSVIVSVLTVVFLLKLADLFSWRAAGLIAALLLTLNSYQLWYAQDIRMYAPVMLFALVAIYFAQKDYLRPSKLRLGLYVVAMVLALYSHYFAIFIFGFVNLFVIAQIWVQHKPIGSLVRWIVAQFVVAALFLPWLAYASNITLSYARSSVDFPPVLLEALRVYSLGLSVPKDWINVAWVFLAIGAIGLWAAWRSNKGKAAWLRLAFVAGYALLPITLGIIVSLVRPMFVERYFMVSAPAFCLLLGLGVVGLYRQPQLWARIVGVAGLVFLVGAQLISLNNYYFDYKYIKSDFGDAARYIQQHVRPDDAMVSVGVQMQQFQALYYFALSVKEPTPTFIFPDASLGGREGQDKKLDEIMATHRGIWFMDWDVKASDPNREIESHLAKHYFQALYQLAGHNRVVYYASPPSTPPQTANLNITCDEELLLKQADVYQSKAKVGEIVPLALHMQALKPTTKHFSMSWRLLDAEGRVISQRDSEPASGFAPSDKMTAGEETVDRYALPIPTYLSPGKYSIVVVPYDKGNGANCRLRQDGKDYPKNQILLTELQVEDAPPVKALTQTAPSTKTNLRFGNLSILGFDWDPAAQRPGDNFTLKAYWRANADLGRDYQGVVRLSDQKGQIIQETSITLGSPAFASNRWQQGREVLTFIDVPIPKRADSGSYKLSLTLQAEGLEPKTLNEFPPLLVTARERSFTAPQMAHAKTADFGGKIELLGYDLQPSPNQPIVAGEEITLTLYWRATQEIAESYKVFTHLVGPDGQIYGQADAMPLNGKAPTNQWVAGEVLTDQYKFAVKQGAPAGQYKLEIGFYKPEGGARLSLADGSGESLTLTTVGGTGQSQ